MGISDWLGLGKAVSEPITAVSDLYTTDKARIAAEAKYKEAETKYQEVIQKPQLVQLETNRILAMSSNFFNSAWAPMLGWTCGFLVLIYYFPQIVIATYVWGKVCIDTGIIKPFPIKPDDILNLVYLLFGFGAHSVIHKKVNNV